MELTLSVREMQRSDIELIVAYWLNTDHSHLLNMGVDVTRIPPREELTRWLQTQLDTPLEKKTAYCIIWEIDRQPVGHCNTNPTVYGKEAYMHLHMWKALDRRKGLGSQLVLMTLPYFFNRLRLEKLYCQPYALNPAPNRTLKKAGFEFVKEYTTVPGSLNFEQPVLLWQMTRSAFKEDLGTN